MRNNPTCPYGSSGPRLNLSLNGNQAAKDADGYGFCPASGAELGENGADMELHGVFRDVELRSYLDGDQARREYERFSEPNG